jgi:hypothetical protein
MFKFIGKTLAGVVLTKDAQAAVGKAIAAKPAGSSKSASGAKSAPPSQARAKALAAMQTQAKGAMTAERQALIQHALKCAPPRKRSSANSATRPAPIWSASP